MWLASAGIDTKVKCQDDKISAAVDEMKLLTVAIYSKVKRLGFHTGTVVPRYPTIVEVERNLHVFAWELLLFVSTSWTLCVLI